MPVLLVLKGHPGCGKSTLARNLVSRMGWPLADKDDARDCLSGLSNDHATLNALAYKIMFRVAEAQLGAGNSCIVDCPLARIELWQVAEELAARYNASIVLVDVPPPPDAEWRARVSARAAAAAPNSSHKPDWERLQALLAGYQNCFLWPETAKIQHHVKLTPASTTDWVDTVDGYLRLHLPVLVRQAPL